MIPHVSQLKLTHHAYFIYTTMAQTIVEKSPVKIFVFRLLRIYAGIKCHFFQSIGNPAGFDIVGASGSTGVTEQTFPGQLVGQGVFNIPQNYHADQPVRGDHVRVFGNRAP